MKGGVKVYEGFGVIGLVTGSYRLMCGVEICKSQALSEIENYKKGSKHKIK
ncbi:hypothetical protein GCM10028791_21460 [Echinicola sediminis]